MADREKMAPEDVAFGVNMRRFREMRGLSQKEFAVLLQEEGVGWIQQTIQRIENGAQRARVSEAAAIARALGTTLDALLDPESAAGAEGELIVAALRNYRRASENAARSAARLGEAHRALIAAVDRAGARGLGDDLGAVLAEARMELGRQ